MKNWGTREEIERRNRIRLSVYAYSYEFRGISIVTDEEYDKLSLEIDPEITTNNKIIDKFFKESFDPCTGMWIRNHPDLKGIINIYFRHFYKIYERSDNEFRTNKKKR